MKKLFFLCLIFLLFSPVSFSEDFKNVTDPAVRQEQQSFNSDIETQKYLDTLTPEQKEKSDAYYEGGYWISIWDFLIQVIIAWIFLSLGLSRWIKNIAEKVRNKNIQNLIYVSFYLIFLFILTFPFAVYTSFFREHKYGLSNMNFAGWFKDEMIGLVLTVIIGGIFITVLYAIVRRVKSKWWIWSACFTSVFLVFMILLEPVFISPLYNKYNPMEDSEIKQEILSIARANGVPADNVYEFNASKQSNRISANVSGIGSTIRISLNDNLMNQCTPAEIKSVMAHETGHYVLNHMYKLSFFFMVIVFICFAFVNWAFNKLIIRFKDKWHISGIDDFTGLPLVIILFTVFLFVMNPIFNTVICSTETEADIFGLNVAREPDGFAEAILKLSTYRKMDPGPLEEFLFYDHPSGRRRIFSAMRWKAEHLNDQ